MTYVAHRVAHVDGDTTLNHPRMPFNHTRSTTAGNDDGFGADMDADVDADVNVDVDATVDAMGANLSAVAMDASVGVGADMEAVSANADMGANVDAAVRGPMQVPGADR